MRTSVLFLLLCMASIFGCGSDDASTPAAPAEPDAPILASIGDKTATIGDTVNFTVGATDPNGSALTYSTDGSTGSGPDPYTIGASFTLDTNTNTWEFAWNTTGMNAGDYYIQFTVTNAASLTDSETIRIRLQSTAPNDQFTRGQTLYNNDCRGSGCHHDEDNDNPIGQFSVVCSIEATIKSATEAGPGSMPTFNYIANQEADIAFYLNNVRPGDC